MKKRVFALLMAGVMVLGGSICTLAEEETESAGEAITVDFTMIDDSIYEGEWVSFFDVFDLYLPTDWTEQEVTKENEEQGVSYVLADDAGDMIAVSYVDFGSADTTLEKLAEQLAESYDTVELWTVNDIPTLVFGNDDSQFVDFTALDDQGGLYQISMVAPADSDPSWTYNVICSFRAHEEPEAETEPETE